MTPDFYLSVKSTIDRLAADVADQLAVANRVNLDDRVNVEEMAASADPCVVWQLAQFKEDPRAPLYSLVFAVGIQTAQDPGNYELTRLMGAVDDVIRIDATFMVRDYSGVVAPTQDVGWLYIADVAKNQIQYDEMTNVRLQEIQARAVRTL